MLMKIIQELMLALPSQDSELGCIDLKDEATKREMDKIRNECEVWMEISYDSIRFFAFTESSLLSGLHRVRVFLLACSQDMVCRTIVLIHRSTDATDDSVLLKPTKELRGLSLGISSHWRGIARAQDPIHEKEEENNYTPIPLTAHDLSLAIRQAAQGICPVLGELRVRVHLGILSLAKKKSGAFKMVVEEGARRGLTCVHQW